MARLACATALCLIACSTPSRATPIPLSLIIEPSSLLEVTVSSTLFGSDTQTTNVDGDVQILLNVEAAGNDFTATEITFLGGSINTDRMTFRYSDFKDLSIRADGIAGHITTPNPPSAVAFGSTFNAAEQLVTFDRGTLRFRGKIRETVDLAEFPVIGSTNGLGSIFMSEVSRTATDVTYDVRLAVPVDISDTLEDAGIPLTVGAAGTIATTSSQFTIALNSEPSADEMMLFGLPALFYFVRRLNPPEPRA